MANAPTSGYPTSVYSVEQLTALINELLGANDFTGATITGSTVDSSVVGGTTPAAGHFTTLDVTDAVALSPASHNVAISPTGTGTVTISPAGVLTMAPTAAGSLNNVVIGASTPLKGTFTYVDQSAATAISAAGTTRTDATALTKAINVIGTALSGTGVILPASATVGVGGSVMVFNAGANLVQVYGAGSDTIDTIAGTTGVALTNALRAQFIVTATGTWVSAKLGATST